MLLCLYSSEGDKVEFTVINAGKGLTSLPDSVPVTTPLVIIRNGNLSHIPAGGIKSWSRVTVLGLISCNIKHIAPYAFRFAWYILKLKISHNPLKKLSPRMFCDYITINELDFSHNEIEIIPSDAFHCINKLTELNLEFNNVAFITLDMFLPIEKITHLYLSHNNITAFQQNLTVNLMKLYKLKVDNNPHLTLGNVSQWLKHSKYINISQCGLKDIYIDLNISHQSVKVPFFFAPNNSLQSSKRIFLMANKIRKLHPMGDICTLNTFILSEHISAIYLQYNAIDGVPGWAFCFYPYLADIDLSYNKIYYVDKYAFNGIEKLRDINLKCNDLIALMIMYLPCSSIYIWMNDLIQVMIPRNATYFNAQLNQMENMPIMGWSPVLIYLYLARNKVSFL